LVNKRESILKLIYKCVSPDNAQKSVGDSPKGKQKSFKRK